MKAYLAGPFGFDEPGKKYLSVMINYLREGIPSLEVINPWELTSEEDIKKYGIKAMLPVMYRNDLRGVRGADFLIAVLNGVQVDDGTAVEIGYAVALGKRIIAYRDDWRLPCRENEFVDFNLMIDQSIIKPVARSLDDLISVVKANFNF